MVLVILLRLTILVVVEVLFLMLLILVIHSWGFSYSGKGEPRASAIRQSLAKLYGNYAVGRDTRNAEAVDFSNYGTRRFVGGVLMGVGLEIDNYEDHSECGTRSFGG